MELRFVAVAWLVLQLTDSPFWVGMIAGVRAFPVIAFGLIGGVVSDRMDRKKILLVTRSMLAIVSFLTAYLVTSGLVELWHLVMISLVSGTIMSLSTTAWRTMVVDIVGRRHALSANALAG